MFPLSDNEETLSRLQQSWADCVHGFNTGVRLKRDRNQMRGLSLLTINEELEMFRKQYENGDAAALLWAMRTCLQENLPAPYWCADGIMERLEKVTKEPCSLHDIFGLAKQFPTTGKKAANSRKQGEQAFELWWRVWKLKASDKALSKEAAIQAVRKVYLPFISQRTARTLFDRKETEQAALRKAHRIRAFLNRNTNFFLQSI